MSDYIKREDAVEALNRHKKTFSCGEDNSKERYAYMQHLADFKAIEDIPTADVVEADKAQKEIDYWHDKAQSYEQTIFKLSLNKADAVDVVRCKDCKHRPIDTQEEGNGFDYEFPEEYGCPGYCDDGYYSQRFKDDFYCAWGERADT